MYNISDQGPAIDPYDTPSDKDRKWREWSANETCVRALLGHVIVDSHISQFSGSPPCQNHAANPLALPSDSAVFQAADPGQWIAATSRSQQRQVTCREVFTSLFSPYVSVNQIGRYLSHFSAWIVLEGFKFLVSESSGYALPAVGHPAKEVVSRALGRLYLAIESAQMENLSRLELLLRWHTVALNEATDLHWLLRSLCHHQKVRQVVLRGKIYDVNFEPRRWIDSFKAKRSLLHAFAIHDTLKKLPIGRLQSFSLPFSIFAAAVVLCATLHAGLSVVRVPASVHWASLTELESAVDDPFKIGVNEDVRKYLNNVPFSLQQTRNIRFDLNLSVLTLKSAASTWAVCWEMSQTIDQLLSRAHVVAG